MRSVLRAHENPALDVAVTAARALQAPLLVLLHVEDEYLHATARRQQFLLEGARAVQRELRQRGAKAVVTQVDRNGNRPQILDALAQQAGLVVAEEPFCTPWLAGVERLCAHTFDAPVWLLDCCGVVPCASVKPGSCHRAYVYEKATVQLHKDCIAGLWKDAPLESCAHATAMSESFPTTSDLETADITELLEEMNVDMTVPPVQHTPGGSAAGYARWNSWLQSGGLKTYAKRRNDAMDVHGPSRMSAYLNAGMVSPLRIAREANASSGSGKAKFLAEFLTWRGLAYSHCYHFPMPPSGATLAQLPSWAQETLRQHERDPRGKLSLRQLAAANTGDRGWDGMQRYLVETGELHNNARMGWGKAIAKWAPNPQAAIDMLVDLNNRFALDGFAPPSYAGLLGCLGLFEGPKQDVQVLGKISFRPPKPKYAALPSVISEVTGKRPTEAMGAANVEAMGAATDFGKGPQVSFYQPPPQPTIHDYLVKPNVIIAENDADGQVPTQDSLPTPRKRRWVLASKVNGGTIDLT